MLSFAIPTGSGATFRGANLPGLLAVHEGHCAGEISLGTPSACRRIELAASFEAALGNEAPRIPASTRGLMGLFQGQELPLPSQHYPRALRKQVVLRIFPSGKLPISTCWGQQSGTAMLAEPLQGGLTAAFTSGGKYPSTFLGESEDNSCGKGKAQDQKIATCLLSKETDNYWGCAVVRVQLSTSVFPTCAGFIAPGFLLLCQSTFVCSAGFCCSVRGTLKCSHHL